MFLNDIYSYIACSMLNNIFVERHIKLNNIYY